MTQKPGKHSLAKYFALEINAKKDINVRRLDNNLKSDSIIFVLKINKK